MLLKTVEFYQVKLHCTNTLHFARCVYFVHGEHSNIVSYIVIDDMIILFTGFAAGTLFSKTGGGVNYQCMPLRPEYNTYSNNGYWSLLSGAEYQGQGSGLFPGTIFDHNVPCARCLAPRSAVMMYPAKRTCPTGWSKEYECKKSTKSDVTSC